MESPMWMWNEPDRIECTGDWRVTTRQADGVPYYSDGRHNQTLIFGREEQFQQPNRVVHILDAIGSRLNLERSDWRWQWPFYEQFIRSYFRDRSCPGWIKIANSRLSYLQRIHVDRGTARHFGHGSRKLFRAKYIGSETIALNDTVLPTRFLRMRYRAGIRRKDLSVYEVNVFRTLEGDGLGGPAACHEKWIQLGSGDAADRIARKKGINLGIRDYPAADPQGRMCPLISFCRMTDDRKWVLSRCVSLCPGTADAVDFRSVIHRADYYGRSDLSNVSLLSQAVTAGQYERFVNG